MGMTAGFLSITNDRLQALIARPEDVESTIFPGEEFDRGPSDSLDIDKSWHGIHYLLTNGKMNSNGPCYNAILGGTPIGEEFGIGPVRYLLPDEVVLVAEALTAISPDVLARSFTPDKMDEVGIYPTIWERDGETGLQYLLSHFESVRSFYQLAAAQERCVLLYIT